MTSPIVSIQDGAENSQQLLINPRSEGISVQGKLTIPGDKSISHRA
ncbi:MAG: hypothetical protein RLZZ499_1342, partial [Cyanobacteriota bacterium]